MAEQLEAAGTRLRQERLDKGLSLTEVARRTNIRVEYLRRLEAGAVEDDRDRIYARAFARAYAVELGVADLEDAFAATPAGDGDEPDVGSGSIGSAPGKARLSARMLIPLAVLGVGALLAVFLLAQDNEGGSPSAPSERLTGESAERDAPDAKAGSGQRGGAPLPTPAQEVPIAEATASAVDPALRISAKTNVSICVYAGDKPTKVDGELAGGDSERLEGSEFTLVFPAGFDAADISATYTGKRVDFIDTQGPSAARVSGPGQAEVVDLPPAGCG